LIYGPTVGDISATKGVQSIVDAIKRHFGDGTEKKPSLLPNNNNNNSARNDILLKSKEALRKDRIRSFNRAPRLRSMSTLQGNLSSSDYSSGSPIRQVFSLFITNDVHMDNNIIYSLRESWITVQRESASEYPMVHTRLAHSDTMSR
jgi:hypothetical protein